MARHRRSRQRGRMVSERRFYDGHDRKVDGSTPTQVSLLCPWKRRFTTIVSAWWNLTSSKLKKSEEKFERNPIKNSALSQYFELIPHFFWT